MVMLLIGWKLLILHNQPAKFGGHKFCGSEDISYLICHMSSQNYLIKGPHDFMDERPQDKSQPCQVWCL